ncbi:MAG: hypothetical protein ABI865_10435 [Nitrosospira sp.]
MEQLGQPLFSLGQVVATPGALDKTHPVWMANCLARHMRGDWGSVCEEDAATNNEAVWLGFRILSAYPLIRRSRAKALAITPSGSSRRVTAA